MKKHMQLFSVLLALALGIVAGSLVAKDSTITSIFDLGGKLFMNALMLVIVPLVASAIITSFSRFENTSNLGKLSGKIFFWFITLNFLAILLSFVITNIFSIPIENSAKHLRLLENMENINNLQPLSAPLQNVLNIFLKIIPVNIVAALAEGQLLGIIFFCIVFGFLMTKIEKKFSLALHDFFNGIFQIMIKFTSLIMRFLPLGVFFLVAKQFSHTGWHSLKPLLLYTTIMIAGFMVFMLIVLPIILKFIAKISPLKLIKAMSPALITAFSTCSSAATLPVTLNCIEKNAKVSNRISSLVLPLGLSLNLAGSSFYIFLTVIFVMQVHGMSIALGVQLALLFLTLLFGFGIVGIPSAALIVSITMLKIFNIPTETIGLFLAVDRIIDMFRTMTNVFTNTTSTIMVASSEGEKVLRESD
jgi:Na+/H+-dicarboxylate symporter